jgi:translocator protein
MNNYQWYQMLIKPHWAPPSWVFGPVWTFLYAIIAITFGVVFWRVFSKQIPWLVALPFGLNLVFNFSFTFLQFGLKNNFLAAMDVILVLITILWSLIAVYPYAAWISYANVPYLIWVTFATVLQISVTYLNWNK